MQRVLRDFVVFAAESAALPSHFPLFMQARELTVFRFLLAKFVRSTTISALSWQRGQREKLPTGTRLFRFQAAQEQR